MFGRHDNPHPDRQEASNEHVSATFGEPYVIPYAPPDFRTEEDRDFVAWELEVSGWTPQA